VSDLEQAVPTAEQLAERARRADRATRGALAANLCLEALVVLLVPRTLAQTYGLGTARTVTLLSFAAVLVVVALFHRRGWGIAVGSFTQLPFMAIAVWIPVFAVLGVIFWTIWLYILNIRHDLVGTPSGFAMLVS
jgi:hypothetical protein